MSDNAKFIKGLFGKLNSDLYGLGEESLLTIEELEQENQMLREALLNFKKQYLLSPCIRNQVDEAIVQNKE